MQTKIIFDEVSLTGRKVIRCVDCNKTLRRQKKFSQTINPFNKNVNGKVKSRSEIHDELVVTMNEWKAELGNRCGCSY